jgi:hypothetical protein
MKPALRVLDTLKTNIDDLRMELPLIEVVCSAALRHRHFLEIQQVMGMANTIEDFTLNQLKDMKIKDYLP